MSDEMRDVRDVRKWLAVLLLIALAGRVAWTVSRPADPGALEALPDQREYLELARSLLDTGTLSFADPRFSDRVHAFRTPGYPAFLAACGADVRIARSAQAVIDTGTVLAAYLLARRWLGPPVSLFAASAVAFNPFLIYFCGLILTETLFTALLAWGMVLVTARRTLPWLVGGMLLALSVLVRPGAIAMPVLLGVLATLATTTTNRRAEPAYQLSAISRRWPLPVGTTMLLLTVLTLLPWAWRNHRVVGQWVWTSTNGGITSYDGFNPDATGASDQGFVARMPHLRRMSETDRDAYLSREAKDFAQQNPRRALELAVIKVARTWSPRPLSESFSRPLYVAAAAAYSIPFLLLAAIGLFGSAKVTLPVKVFLSAPAVYLTLSAALSVGSLRYRIPAEVPMAVLAAGGFGAIGDLLRGRRGRRTVRPFDAGASDSELPKAV